MTFSNLCYTPWEFREIQNFIDNNNGQYNWSKRFEFILKLEEEEEEMENTLMLPFDLAPQQSNVIENIQYLRRRPVRPRSAPIA